MARVATIEEYAAYKQQTPLERAESVDMTQYLASTPIRLDSRFSIDASFRTDSCLGEVERDETPANMANKLKAALPKLKKAGMKLLGDVFRKRNAHKQRARFSMDLAGLTGGSAPMEACESGDGEDDGAEASRGWKEQFSDMLMQDKETMKHKHGYKAILVVAVLVGLFGSNCASILVSKQFDNLISVFLILSALVLAGDTALWCYIRSGYTFSIVFFVDSLAVFCLFLEVSWLLAFIMVVFDTLLPSSVLSRSALNRMQNAFLSLYQAGRLANIPRLLRLIVPELDSAYKIYKAVYKCCGRSTCARCVRRRFCNRSRRQLAEKAAAAAKHVPDCPPGHTQVPLVARQASLVEEASREPARAPTHAHGSGTAGDGPHPASASAAPQLRALAADPMLRFRRWSQSLMQTDPGAPGSSASIAQRDAAGAAKDPEAGGGEVECDAESQDDRPRGQSIFTTLGMDKVVVPLAEQVGTVILEHITARAVLMVLIIKLLTSGLGAQESSTQKEMGLAQLGMIAHEMGDSTNSSVFAAALAVYVKGTFGRWGTFYNEDEPLVYLRVGYDNELFPYTDKELLANRRHTELSYAAWDHADDNCHFKLERGHEIRQLSEMKVCYAAAIFDRRVKIEDEAVFGLGLTIGMVLTIGIALVSMASDLQRMLIKPINQGIAIVRGMLQDPSTLLSASGAPALGAGLGMDLKTGLEELGRADSLQPQSYIDPQGQMKTEVAEAKSQLLTAAHTLTRPQSHGWMLKQMGELLRVLDRAEKQVGIRTGLASEGSVEMAKHLATAQPFLSALESILDSAKLMDPANGETSVRRSEKFSSSPLLKTSVAHVPELGESSTRPRDRRNSVHRRIKSHDGVLLEDMDLGPLSPCHEVGPGEAVGDGRQILSCKPSPPSSAKWDVSLSREGSHLGLKEKQPKMKMTETMYGHHMLQDAVLKDVLRTFPETSEKGQAELEAQVQKLQKLRGEIDSPAYDSSISKYRALVDYLVMCRMADIAV